VGDVELRSDADRSLLAGWNATPAAGPPRTVHALFEEQAASTPSAVAVADDQGRLTYAALDAAAGRIARRLIEAGAGPERGVALLSGRHAGCVAGLLGILKSGSFFVPLDASLPSARLATMIRLAGVRAVLAQPGMEHAVPVPGLPVILLDDPFAGGARPSGEAAAFTCRPARPASTAYVIFTSGSTGEPRGVVVEHRAIADRALARAAAHRFGPGDRVLHFLSMSFDASLEALLPPLVSGAAVVMHPDPRGETPEGCFARVRAGGITVADVPVGFLHELADHAARSGERLPGTLRLIVSGGESPSGERIAALLRAAGGPLVVENDYGPTETTVVATAHALRLPEEAGEPVPIGRPVAHTTIHLLDGRMNPAPLGALGEIFIGGAGVARGYAGRPSETALRFVPDPFSPEPGARLYRSGDMGRHLEDGTLIFAGRRDGQIKLRGHRIELGEIEAALLRLDGVREAAVRVVEKPAGISLAACIVPTPGARLDAQEIRGALGTILPEPMVPSAVILMERMPRTSSGKVDRRALPLPGPPAGRATRNLPRDGQERAIAQTWREVLRLDQVDVEESFFEAGGNSLLAVRLVALLRREHGIDLPVAAVFQHPTIAGLASVARGGAAAAEALVTLRSGSGLPPVVFVHAVGGGVSDFRHVASHLDPRRPMYALHGLGDAPARIEEAGARCSAAIESRVPAGPIHLVGWSHGGLVAWEAAHRLRAAGRAVGALVLVDAPAPGVLEGVAFSFAAEPPADLEADDARAWIAGVESRARAAREYRPRPYGGDVVLIRGTESEGALLGDDWLGWQGLVEGRLALEWASGSHMSMMEGEGARRIASIVEQHASGRAAAAED
jgi:amino acid adenylation domain-containing protein